MVILHILEAPWTGFEPVTSWFPSNDNSQLLLNGKATVELPGLHG